MRKALSFAGQTGLSLLLALGLTPASEACALPPQEQVVDADMLLAGARDVSLARVVHVTELGGGMARYDFAVEKRLLGAERQEFSLEGRVFGRYREREASPDHSDAEFWTRGGGRLTNESDCVLRPAFRLGERYLMFMNQTATWRSFERIRAADDKWLAYVEDKLGAKTRQ